MTDQNEAVIVERPTPDVLALLADVGIAATPVQDGPAGFLTLQFASEDDFQALEDVAARSDVEEFTCSWPRRFPTGLRGEFQDGPYFTSVPTSALPEVADLLRRELAGEFALTERQAKRRAIAVWNRRVAVFLLMVNAFLAIGLHQWLALIGIVLALAVYESTDHRLRHPFSRLHLDRVRARTAGDS
jgi:hypothetical protein